MKKVLFLVIITLTMLSSCRIVPIFSKNEYQIIDTFLSDKRNCYEVLIKLNNDSTLHWGYLKKGELIRFDPEDIFYDDL